MRSSSEINRVRTMPIPGKRGPGHPRKTWDECVKLDLTVCGLSASTTLKRGKWRSSVKNCQLEPTPQRGSAPKSVAEPLARRILGPRTRSSINNKTGLDRLDRLMIREMNWHQSGTKPFLESMKKNIFGTCGSL